MDISHTNNLKNAKFFYTSSLFSSLSVGITGPLYIIYLLSINFNPAMIGIILAIQRITIFIFEYPTGIIADKYGRKVSVLISFLSMSIILIFWFLTKNFYVLTLLSILWGISYTFQSGSKESLMIDNLNLAENDSNRDKIFSRNSAFGYSGLLIGGLIATFITIYSIGYIWLASSFSYLILFTIFLIFIKDKQFINPEKINKFKSFIKSSKKNISTAFKNKKISGILSITFLVTMATSFYGFSYPVYFREILEIPDYYFGILGSISAFVGILGSLFVEKILKRKRYTTSINYFLISLSIFFIAFALTGNIWLTLIIFIFCELLINGWYPLFQTFSNKYIPNDIRSSILSLNSSFSLIAIAIAEITAGILLTFILPNYLIAMVSIFFIITIITINIIKKSRYITDINQPNNDSIANT